VLSAYMGGLTDTYPSFGSKIQDSGITFDYTKPEKSSRLFAIPLLGLVLRYLLLLPFMTYVSYIGFAAMLGRIIGSFSVLFKGKYPESIHEFSTDAFRLNASYLLYFSGMSDKYPSFGISLRHPMKKFLLIAAVVILQYLLGLGATNLARAFSSMNAVSNVQDTVMKQSFMKACDTKGTTTAYCECTYNGLHAKYSFAEINAMGTQFQQTNKIPDQMAAVIQSCSNLLPAQ